MKIISLYTGLNTVGGAQNMCLSIHSGLTQKKEIKQGFVSSFTSYQQLDPIYNDQIQKKEYLKFNPVKLILNHPDAIFISHHRKVTTLLMLTAKLLFKKVKIVHVAHNEFNNLRFVSLFPKQIISVSKRVKENHKLYFKLKNIHVIYNGIVSSFNLNDKVFNSIKIKILFPGRVTDVKQQLKITAHLKGHLPENVTILFAGDGPQLEMLKKETEDDPQFNVLGYVKDMEALYNEVAFVLLFSKNEGLPLSLIEAISYGVPCICNDVGGNVEVIQNGKNGLIVSTVDALKKTLQMLPAMTNETYAELSMNAIEVFKNKFSYDKMIDNYYKYIVDEFKES